MNNTFHFISNIFNQNKEFRLCVNNCRFLLTYFLKKDIPSVLLA